ncbi:MAG: rhomboid family intramembrane serine protease [Alphaproteobacteria bacterium]|nr:rhomboid family intramembrane serine protease [Alphaproteobacteria bacterium]
MSQAYGGLYIPRPGRGIIGLIVANVVAWIAYMLMLRLGLSDIAARLPLTPAEFLTGDLWQPLTAMFIHSPAATGHLLMNMLFLWIFGVEVEQVYGTRSLVMIYLACGLAGAAVVVLLGLVVWLLAPTSSLGLLWISGTLGASGAVLGITGCWGGMLWHQTRSFLFLGPMRVRTFLFIIVGIQLLGALSYDNVSYSSHLGGLAAGVAFGRGWLRPGMVTDWLDRRKLRRLKAQQARRRGHLELLDGGLGDHPPDNGRYGDNGHSDDNGPLYH